MLHATKANELAKIAQFSQLKSRIKAAIDNGELEIIVIEIDKEHKRVLEQHGYKITKSPTDVSFKISWEEA